MRQQLWPRARRRLGFERFRGVELSAPSLMWVEATSALHAMRWRGELTTEQPETMRDRILNAPVQACLLYTSDTAASRSAAARLAAARLLVPLSQLAVAVA